VDCETTTGNAVAGDLVSGCDAEIATGPDGGGSDMPMAARPPTASVKAHKRINIMHPAQKLPVAPLKHSEPRSGLFQRTHVALDAAYQNADKNKHTQEIMLCKIYAYKVQTKTHREPPHGF
jgi:hypothetical protein